MRVVVRAATRQQLRRKAHVMARPVTGEHDMIDLATPQHLAAAQEVKKRARVAIYSVHDITVKPCTQAGTMPMLTTTTGEGNASTSKQHRTTKADRRRQLASVRAARSANTQLKRKLKTLEDRMKRGDKRRRQCAHEHNYNHVCQHCVQSDIRTGQAHEAGGNCKRHRRYAD